jgi:protease I
MTGDIADKKILMVVAQKNFRDEEFFEPRDVFEDVGISITVASNKTNEATGVLGGSVKPDIAINDVKIADFDAIVIAGGGGAREYLWNNVGLHELVKEAFEMEKVVAAICVSPVVLAKAGILEGKRATVYGDLASIAELEKAGAIYEDEDVIVVDNIITARDPASAIKYGQAVLTALEKY